MPATGLRESWDLEAEDGGGSEVHGDALGLTFSRFSPGQILDHMAELARRTGAAVIPLGCPAILTSEADPKHLPESLRAEAIVVAPESLTGQAIQLVITPRPEPRQRPALPQFPYHPNPVATGSVTISDAPDRGIARTASPSARPPSDTTPPSPTASRGTYPKTSERRSSGAPQDSSPGSHRPGSRTAATAPSSSVSPERRSSRSTRTPSATSANGGRMTGSTTSSPTRISPDEPHGRAPRDAPHPPPRSNSVNNGL
ncbi:conserved hypothetical protein [Streptomyces sviceus ATCC 29083]|uniref:Uncharacterized protein n=1 Tax=Streptomyces sviceus (strain ATCC 29083 / DSM 924 / JCM 4929 / NBRC 13980 / NCIMB 11184 / NRRL 5439 / UC 5370) TaxID=463191 RepID=B5HPY2_STRX2|nr:conserved hypothetical protein [Streptomyces sviceus ATCC 29083]